MLSIISKLLEKIDWMKSPSSLVYQVSGSLIKSILGIVVISQRVSKNYWESRIKIPTRTVPWRMWSSKSNKSNQNKTISIMSYWRSSRMRLKLIIIIQIWWMISLSIRRYYCSFLMKVQARSIILAQMSSLKSLESTKTFWKDSLRKIRW